LEEEENQSQIDVGLGTDVFAASERGTPGMATECFLLKIQAFK